MIASIGMPGGWEWIFITSVLAFLAFILREQKMRRFAVYVAAVVLVLVILMAMVSFSASKALVKAREVARNRVDSQRLSPDEPGVEARVHDGDRSVEVKVSRSGVPVLIPVPSGSTNHASASGKSSPDAWSAGIEREFKSHLYPSAESAVIATVDLMLSELKEGLPPDARPELRMNVSKDFYCDASPLAVVIRQKLPVADVRIVDALPTDGDLGMIGLSLSKPQDMREEQSVQTIEATMHLGDKTLTRQAQFVDKPWIEDLNRWQKQTKSKDKSFIVAKSTELCPTQEEACEQARNLAAQQMYRLIKPRLQKRGLNLDHGWIRSEIAAMMSGTHAFCQEKPSEQIVVDTFVQRFDRPYGEVYRAVMLIDTSPRNVIDLTQYFRKQLSGQRESQRNTLLSAIGLLAVIFVVYLFLNAATKGYYVWSIRIAAIVLTAAGIGFVLFLV